MAGVGLSVAVEVEVGVVSHIDDSRSVGLSLIADVDGVVVGQSHCHVASDVTREALFAVRSAVGQLQSLLVNLLAVIDAVLEALWTAMQTVAEVIQRQLILLAVQREAAVSNAVSVATDRGTEVRGLIDIVLNAVEAEHHILHSALLVGHEDRDDTSAEVSHADLHPIHVLQGKEIRLFTIHFRLEVSLVESRSCQYRLLWFCCAGGHGNKPRQ